MPNRIIRDGILTSEKVDALSEAEELFYRRLMNVVDDYGRYSANPKLLLTACYPLRAATKTLEEISLYLTACQVAGLLEVYTIKGSAVLQIGDFRQRLRVMHSKWRSENGHLPDTRPTDDGHASDNSPTDDGVLEEKRREKKRRESSPTPSNERSAGIGLLSAVKKTLAVAGDSEEREEPGKTDPYVTALHLETLQQKSCYLRLDVAKIADQARTECKASRMRLSFLVQRLDWEHERQFKANGARSEAEGNKLKAEERAALET